MGIPHKSRPFNMKPDNFINYGINWDLELASRTEKDWEHMVGVSASSTVSIPMDEREQHLPKGERQNIGQEKMDCASRAPNNWEEATIDYLLEKDKLPLSVSKFLETNHFLEDGRPVLSDSFLSTNAKTTRQGNSLKAPLEARRLKGLVAKSMLPQGSTFEEHHDPKRITTTLENIGKQYAQIFAFNYDRVYEVDFPVVLKKDMIVTAGYAWDSPKDGKYQRVEYTPNHAFLTWRPKFYVFDNYEESDGDFIKDLAEDYNFMDYGYRPYLASINAPSEPRKYVFFKDVLAALFDKGKKW